MAHDKENFTATDVSVMLGNHQAEPAQAEQGIAARVAVRAFEMIARHALRRELLALDKDGELDRILGEGNLGRADVEKMLANHPDSGRLLNKMAARLNVEGELYADPIKERDMWHVCTLCDAQGRCKHWLASGATEGYEAFCANAAELNDLKHKA